MTWARLRGDDADLIGKVFAQGEAGATDRAKHVATVGEFADPHFFAEANLTKLAASRSLKLANLKITTNGSLTKGQGGVAFKVGGKDRHGGLVVRKLIETVSQQQNDSAGQILSGIDFFTQFPGPSL